MQQLLEYKRFKDSARHRWSSGSSEHRGALPRVPGQAGGEADEPPPVDLDEVQVWDLLTRSPADEGSRRRASRGTTR